MDKFAIGCKVWWWERNKETGKTFPRRGVIHSFSEHRVKVRTDGTIVLRELTKLRIDDRNS